MKLIWAVVRREKKKEIEKSLLENGLGITGLITWTVLGIGEETQKLLQPHELSYIKIEILVRDDQVEDVVKALREAAWTGYPGDGRLAILPVENVIHIGSGKSGDEALRG
jgi:nitrogen regulatory protein PII